VFKIIKEVKIDTGSPAPDFSLLERTLFNLDIDYWVRKEGPYIIVNIKEEDETGVRNRLEKYCFSYSRR